jgi:hypothetical protein
MKYFPFSMWSPWAHHIPFHLITWRSIDPQLQVFPHLAETALLLWIIHGI